MIERYQYPEMGEIWSRQARFQAWMDVEMAWLDALEKRSLVPLGSASACRQAPLDILRLDIIEKEVRHEVIAFLEMVREGVGEEGRWIHHGLTSSDVMDTGVAIQCVAAAQTLLTAGSAYIESLLSLAERTLSLPSAGRTHGMHAEPQPFGLRFARHGAAAIRAWKRLKEAKIGIAVGKMAGAVGTYPFMEPEVEKEALLALGLTPETAPSQVVARDRHAAFLESIALFGAVVEQFAIEIRHLQRTEVGEVEEPFTAGQKGSSAMPHKRNPIVSERLTGQARLLRGYAQTGLENVALWHERDISHSSNERVTLADSTTLLHYMLVRAEGVAKGLVVNERAVQANLNRGGGVMMSSAALLALVECGMTREEAYEIVQSLSFQAKEGGDFRALLQASPQAGPLLADRMDEIFDTSRSLRHGAAILKGVKELL